MLHVFSVLSGVMSLDKQHVQTVHYMQAASRIAEAALLLCVHSEARPFLHGAHLNCVHAVLRVCDIDEAGQQLYKILGSLEFLHAQMTQHVCNCACNILKGGMGHLL